MAAVATGSEPETFPRLGQPGTISVLDDSGEAPVNIGRVSVPSRFRAWLNDPRLDFVVEARLLLHERECICTELHLIAWKGKRIGTTNTRFAIDSFLDDALMLVTYRAYVVDDEGQLAAFLAKVRPQLKIDPPLEAGQLFLMPVWIHPDPTASVTGALSEIQRAGSKKLRRLERVAQAYLNPGTDEAGKPRKGYRAVELALGVSYDTARQYVKDARREGLIPPAPRRRRAKEGSA